MVLNSLLTSGNGAGDGVGTDQGDGTRAGHRRRDGADVAPIILTDQALDAALGRQSSACRRRWARAVHSLFLMPVGIAQVIGRVMRGRVEPAMVSTW